MATFNGHSKSVSYSEMKARNSFAVLFQAQLGLQKFPCKIT